MSWSIVWPAGIVTVSPASTLPPSTVVWASTTPSVSTASSAASAGATMNSRLFDLIPQPPMLQWAQSPTEPTPRPSALRYRVLPIDALSRGAVRTLGTVEPAVFGLIAVAAVLHVTWNVLLKTAGDPLAAATLSMVIGTVFLVPAVAVGWWPLGPPSVPPGAFLGGRASGILQAVYFGFLAPAYPR